MRSREIDRRNLYASGVVRIKGVQVDEVILDEARSLEVPE